MLIIGLLPISIASAKHHREESTLSAQVLVTVDAEPDLKVEKRARPKDHSLRQLPNEHFLSDDLRDLAVINAKKRYIFSKRNPIVSLSAEAATLRQPFIFLLRLHA